MNNFRFFKSECQKWIDRFELNDWDVSYRYRVLRNKKVRARIYYDDFGSKKVFITLNIDTDNLSREDIKSAAKHEIIHLLLARLHIIIRKTTNFKEIEKVEEELIKKLEKVIL